MSETVLEEKLAAAQYPVELMAQFRKAIMEAKERADEAAATLRATAAYVRLETLNEELERVIVLARDVQGVDPTARLDISRGWVLPG